MGEGLKMRTVAGFNLEAKKGKEAARRYCQMWQMDLMKMGTDLSVELTKKMINQATYNVKRADLNKKTEELNKCIKLMNETK
jgi:hypothetical protein